MTIRLSLVELKKFFLGQETHIKRTEICLQPQPE